MKPFRLFRWGFTSCCGHGSAPAPVAGTSRRQFIRLAAGGAAAVLAAPGVREPAAAQVRVFPPPPPAVSPIEGLIEG